MVNAADISGTVFKNGSATLLARVIGADGQPLTSADVLSAKYTIYQLDENDPDAGTAVAGHDGVAGDPVSLVYDTLQNDALWDVDTTGYNFKHDLDVSTSAAFPMAGKHYRVVYELTPIQGQVVLVRFRVHAI